MPQYDYEKILDNIDNQRKGLPPAPVPPITAPVNPALDTLGLNLQRAATANPVEEAKRRKLSGELGVPAAILPPTAQAEEQAFLKNARAQDIMAKYPSLAKWAQNPNYAAVAGKDMLTLGEIESHARTLPTMAGDALQIGKNLAGSAAAAFPSANAAIWSFVQAAGSILSTNVTKPLADTVGSPDLGEMLRSSAADFRNRQLGMAKDIAPNMSGMGAIERGVYSGVQSAASTLMLLPLSVATGSPTPILAGLSGITAGTALGEATDKGLPLNEALIHATKQGLIEYGTELFPVGNLLKNLTGKTGLLKTARDFMIREGIGEQAATVLQDLDKWATLHPEKPFSDYLAERPEAALETLVATAVGGSIQVGGARAVAKGMGMMQQQSVMELGRAQRAEENHLAIQQLGTMAVGHPLRERDPAAFHEFIETMAEDGNLSDVYVDGKVLGEVFNQSGITEEELMRKMPELVQQLGEAVKTNGEVRISLADYATYVAGTDVEKGIIDHLRASPDGMTYTEAQNFYKTQKDDLTKQAETLMADTATSEEYKADVQKVHDSILEQMNKAGRFTPEVNAAYAVPFREFYAVNAAKMGMTPSELYKQLPLNFAPMNTGNILNQGDSQIDTPEFKNWFGDAKTVNHDGTPMLLYHGTNSEDVTVFDTGDKSLSVDVPNPMGDNIGTFFSANKSDSKDFGKTVGAYYVSLKNPKVFKDQNEFRSFIRKNSGRTPDIRDEEGFITVEGKFENNTRRALEAQGYDGVIIKRPGYNRSRSSDKPWVIAFEPTQIKSAIGNKGTFNPNDPNILNQSAEPSLIIQHNLTEGNLLHADRMGGIPVPSLAITQAEHPLEGFGSITLLGSSSMADPKGYAGTKVFGADIYSPRYPQITHIVSNKATAKLEAELKEFIELTGASGIYPDEIRTDGMRHIARNSAVRAKFLTDRGIKPEVVMDKNGKPDRYRTDAEIGRQVSEAGLDSQLDEYAGELLASMNGEEKIFQGFTNSGNRKYIPHNLDNVIKILKKEMVGGEGFNYGVGTIRSKFTPQFKSLEQIRKAKDRLMDAAAFDKVRKEIDGEFEALAERVSGAHPVGGEFRFSTTLSGTLYDAAKMGLRRAFDENGFDMDSVTDEMLEESAEFLEKLRHLPTAYFEAKILRAVDLSEFKGAVVPDNISDKALAALSRRGITNIVRYDPNKPGDRAEQIRKLSTEANLLFQGNRAGYNPDTFTISLLKGADLSSTLHEGGHFYLEALAELASRPEAPQQIKDDFRKTLDWFGITGQNKVAPPIEINDELLETGKADTKNASGLMKSDMENDQQGVIPGQPTNINRALKRGDYTTADIAKGWTKTRQLLRDRYGDTVTLYRADAPKEKHHADTQVVYMGDEKLAKHFENRGRKVEAFTVPVDDVLAFNVQTNGYYEFIVKRPNNATPAAGRTPEEVWASMSLDQKRPYHEQWAQSFERYMLEGKAPTTEMQPVFARFRAWMLSVYKSLEAFLKQNPLAGKLNDEVRGIFDRLIAAEDSIRATESVRAYAPLFETAEDAGMTPKQFQEYLDLGEQATERAVDDLSSRSLRDMKWLSNAKERVIKAMQNEAKAKRKVVEAEVTREVMSEPINQARTFLKTGETTDPETGDLIKAVAGFKLDSKAVAELFPGTGPITLDKAKLRGMTAEDGLSPDLAAQMFGFPSGEALILELTNGESAKEKIQAVTDQRMLEQHGEMSSEEDIERAAEAAIHNEARARFMATGLKILMKSPLTASQLNKAAKAAAENTIASRKVRDLRPGQYERAETKANKEALKLAAKDPQGAISAQRAALLNNRLAKAAGEATTEVEKILRYVAKFQEAGTRKGLDPEYMEQIDDLLRPFDFRKGTTLKQIDKRQSLADWVSEQEALGFEPAIDPALLDEAKLKSYKNMSMEELRGFVDSIKQVEHLGRLKKKLLLAKDEREFDAIVLEGMQAIEDNANRTVEERATPTDAIGIAGKWWRQMTADHRKFASIMREMDGGKDNGFMFNYFLKTMNQAGDNETQMKAEATEALAKLFKAIDRNPVPGNIYSKKRHVPGANLSMTHEQRLMFAMNWGNEGNRQRLLDGGISGNRALSITQAEAILDTLTKAEWDFVQGVWDYIAEYKPQVAALERRLTGVEPEWVEPAPIQTKYGTYKGGYFPVKYDVELSSRSESFEAATDLRMGMKGAFNASATRNGFTKARAEAVINRPILLSYNAISQHVSEVTHRLSWQEWLVDSNRLLKALDNPIREHYGAEILRTLRDTVVDIAAGDAPAKNGTETAINRLRVGSTVVGMGWRVTTALLQPSGLAQSWVRVGGKYIARGVYQFTKSPITSGEFVNSKSKMMTDRGRTMQREINEVLNTIRAGDKVSAFKASYFTMIGKMQRMVDIPTWLGAYEKAADQLNLQNAATADERARIEEQAAALADQAVLDSQSGGQLKDLAKVQRGSPLQKIFTNFYSYFSATYNLNVEAVRRTNFKSPSQVAMLATDMVLLNSVPVLFSVALKELLKGGCGDDLECLGQKLASEQLNFLFGQMVLLREAGVAIDVASGGQGYGYQGPAGLRFFADLYKTGQQANQGEADMAFFKAANNVMGTILHYPAGQVNATMEGIIAIEEGKVRGMGILPAIIAGPPKK